MELLACNLSGRVRREILNGRECLVAPLTLLVPGVLNGSKGPLYYPEEEVDKNPEQWNSIPIVVYHPERDGKAVSARDPSILNTQGIGHVFRAASQGKLVAEGWFDVETTKRIYPSILTDIQAGKPIELSTGLFTENEEEDGEYNGKEYTHIARNYVPDHLAILPGKVGACSVQDGCGVLVNGGPGSGPQPGGAAKLGPLASKAAKEAGLASKDVADVLKAGTATDEWVNTLHQRAVTAHTTAAKMAARHPKGGDAVKAHTAAAKAHESSITKNDLADNEHDDAHRVRNLLKHALKADNIKDMKDGVCHYELNGKTYRTTYSTEGDEVVPGDSPTEVSEIAGYTRKKKDKDMATKVKPMTENERNKAIKYITTNCACWKDEGDVDVLNEFSDEKLANLVSTAKGHREAEAVVNTLREYDSELTVNAMPAFIKKAIEKKKKAKAEDEEEEVENMDEEEEEEEVVPPTKNKGGKSATKNERPMTAKEWLKNAPSEIRSVVHNAMRRELAEKQKLISVITANKANLFSKEQLNAKDATELEMLAKLAGGSRVNNEEDELEALYLGQNTPIGNEEMVDNEEDILQLPSTDWAALSKSRKQG